MIQITINTELVWIGGDIYKPLVTLNAYEVGVRTITEPVAIVRGDDLQYHDAVKQLGEIAKTITITHAEGLAQRIDQILAEIDR